MDGLNLAAEVDPMAMHMPKPMIVRGIIMVAAHDKFVRMTRHSQYTITLTVDAEGLLCTKVSLVIASMSEERIQKRDQIVRKYIVST